MNILLLLLTVTPSAPLADLQFPQHLPHAGHHNTHYLSVVTPCANAGTNSHFQTLEETTTFTNRKCELFSSDSSSITIRNASTKGVKLIGGGNVNKIMHVQNGNRRNLGYRIAAWNCNRGLLKQGDRDSDKLTDIKLFIEENKPHLFGVIESDIHGPNSRIKRSATFTTDEIHDKLKIEGYSIYLPDTWKEHNQARLIVYISDLISVKVKDISLENKDLPTITFEVGFGRERKSYVNFYYREWTSGVTGERSELSQKDRFERQVGIWRNLSANNRDMIVLGDANFCYLKCNDQDYSKHLKEISTIATDFYLEESFSQLIDKPTRTELKGGRVEKGCLDHIATNVPGKCNTIKVKSAGNSDHLGILVTKHTKEIVTKPQVVKKRSYKNFVEEDFLREIRFTNFDEILDEDDEENAAKLFSTIFRAILDNHAPVKVFQTRTHYAPWLRN